MLPLQKLRRRKPVLHRSRLDILQVKHFRLRLSLFNSKLQIPIQARALPLTPLQPIQERLPVNPRKLARHLPIMPRNKRITDTLDNLRCNLRRWHQTPFFIRENGKIEKELSIFSRRSFPCLSLSFVIFRTICLLLFSILDIIIYQR